MTSVLIGFIAQPPQQSYQPPPQQYQPPQPAYQPPQPAYQPPAEPQQPRDAMAGKGVSKTVQLDRHCQTLSEKLGCNMSNQYCVKDFI